MSETTIYPTTYLDLPTSDGQPMGETDGHAIEMTEFLRDVLRDHYGDDPMVYVASNNFVYYDASDVRKSVCPDCYVIKGIPKRLRDSYQAWAEGGALPQLIFELTSHSTWRTDIGHKLELYQSWGCNEYFLYDLTADRILNHLLGYRLEDGVYQEIPFTVQGRLFSEELQLELAHHEGHLRFFIPGAKRPIPTRWERAEEAEQARQEETRRAEQAEQEKHKERRRAEKAEEEREGERLRAESQSKRAERAEQEKQAERERADEQSRRAEQAEQELERLKAEMAKLRNRHSED